MAYSNGIFYLDLENGSDATRTALTACIASNPTGTVTRITKTSHGLVTGAVVDLTLFSAWLNEAWKISVVDANSFDLDGAVWQTTADANGTVTPRGGSSWADAWRTISSGPTSSRVKAGDTIRIAKSPDPYSIGSATWTNASSTVTLSTSQTLTIDNCETAWTAVNASTVATNATRKQGSFSVDISRSGGFSTSTLYAYKTLPATTNYSAYNAITLWYRPQVVASAANTFKLCLCSDTAGTVIVDEFILPATVSTSDWRPLDLTRVGGGQLGASIQSIALYTHTVLPTATAVVSFDNIQACQAAGLNLMSLISKDGVSSGGTEGWWCIQSIDGTTVVLDTAPTNTSGPTTATRGYTGASETVATYARETIKIGPLSGAASVTQGAAVSGTPGSYVNFLMGWNTSTNIQDGETVWDGVNTLGNFLAPTSNTSYINVERYSACRIVTPLGQIGQGTPTNWTVSGTFMSCCSYFAGTRFMRSQFYNLVTHSIQNGFSGFLGVNSGLKMINCAFKSYTATPVSIAGTTTGTSDILFYNCVFENNATSDVSATALVDTINFTSCSFKSTTNFSSGRQVVLKDCTLLGTTEFPTITANTNYRFWSQNHDLSGYEFIVTDGGTMNTEATDRVGATGKMWRLILTNATRTAGYPLNLPVGQFAVNAGSLVTVNAWMKKSHATNCNGRLRVRAYQLAGITSDVVGTLADNTSWQQLSITFTPTEAGVFEVDALAEYVSANASVYIDEIEVTQA
jgi:hypothetical protein